MKISTLSILAFPGDRTENVLWRLDNGQVDNLHPKMVVLLIGTNNVGAETPSTNRRRGQGDIQQYRKRCPDAVILLQAIFPHGPTPTDSPGLRSSRSTESSLISPTARTSSILISAINFCSPMAPCLRTSCPISSIPPRRVIRFGPTPFNRKLMLCFLRMENEWLYRTKAKN